MKELMGLAEQILETIYEFEDTDSHTSTLLEDALNSGDDLEFAIDSALSYLKDCDCEDYDFYKNKFDQITEDGDSDE